MAIQFCTLREICSHYVIETRLEITDSSALQHSFETKNESYLVKLNPTHFRARIKSHFVSKERFLQASRLLYANL